MGSLLAYAVVMQTFGPAPLAETTWTPIERTLIAAAVILVPAAFAYALTGKPGDVLSLLERLLGRYSWRTPVLLALVLRLGWVLLSGVEQSSDFHWYDRMAEGILAGESAIRPLRPPGPAILFAAHYRLFGHHPVLPQITIAFLSSLQVLLLYRLLQRAHSHRAVAVLGALLLAVWPEHLLFVNLLGGDVLFSTAVLAAIVLLERGRSSERSLWPAVSSGVALGIGHWMRPTAPLFLVAGLASLVIGCRCPWGQRARQAALLLVGFAATILPIAASNYRHFGVVSANPVASSGWSLFTGTTLSTQGRFRVDLWERFKGDVDP